MYNNIKKAKTILLSFMLMMGISSATMAATYTATTSGNWSSTTTWGGTAPGFNITGADYVIIPVGVTVTQDANLTINNAMASLSVVGTLTGSFDLNMMAGTLSGAGSVALNSINVGTAGLITSVGTISVAQIANSQPTLVITAVMSVSNTIILNAGTIQLGTGGVVNLANNVTLNMAGGTFNASGGIPTLAGSYNLIYSGSVSSIGAEASLAGLQNVTVSLATATNQLTLAGNLAVTGVLSLQQGVLNLGGNTLTIIGGITTSAMGTIAGSATSNIVVNGTGSIGTIAFTSGAQMLHNLTLAIAAAGSVSLASDVTVGGVLTLTGSDLNLNGHTLTIAGTVVSATTGAFIGSSASSIVVSGTGAAGTLMFSAAGNTLGTLTVNRGATGSVVLGSALTVSGSLALIGGTLNMNGQNLTIGGAINSSLAGTLSGTALSNLTFSGTGNAGTLVFAPAANMINNLTINIGSTGSVTMGSNLTVAGALTLAQGKINIAAHDLTLAATGSLTGGSSASYVVTSDTGRLIMTVANAGANGMFHVGTIASYAPVKVTNNSTTTGTFNVLAHSGVLLNGTAGVDESLTQPMVNTSWNVESSIATGANVNLMMGWASAMEVNAFDHTQAYVSHYTSGAWNTSAITAATVSGSSYSMTLSGVTSFSPFAVFGKNVALGIVTVNNSDALQIYPNPVSDRLTILIGSSDKTNVEISDLSGQIVARYELTGAEKTIGIADLSTGSYFIKVSNSGNNSVRKFIKI